MRIEASLQPRRGGWAPVLALLVWGMAFIILVLAVLLATQALALRAEQPEIVARLERLSGQARTDTPAHALPPAAELGSLREQVRELNALGSARGWPTSKLLARLERWLPDRVYLTSLQHRRRLGEIQIVAESASTEALTAFLVKLEQESHFTEVLLLRQGRRSGSGDVIQFEVRIRERL